MMDQVFANMWLCSASLFALNRVNVVSTFNVNVNVTTSITNLQTEGVNPYIPANKGEYTFNSGVLSII